MDKSVYNMKAEKIQRLVKQGDYETAVKICNTIDWSMVRSVRMLSLVSSVYEHVQQYDTAIDILLMAYEEAPAGRRYLYKLTELSLAAGKIRDAENYYRSYLQEATDDNSRYILRYKIAEAKGESLDKRITILEAYKRTEFDEEWSYRLALLYAKAKQPAKCVALCDEIILWFGRGPYVDKAIDLKARFAPASDPVDNYRVRREPRPVPVKKEPVPEKKAEPELELVSEEEAEAAIAAILPGGAAPAQPQEPKPVQQPEELPKIVLNDAKSEPYVQFADEGAFFPEEEEEKKAEPEQDDVKIYKPSWHVETPEAADTVSKKTQEISLEDIRAKAFNNEDPARWKRAAAGKQEFDQMELDWNSEAQKRVPHILYAAADTPAEGLKQAVECLAEAHRAERTPVGKVTKISAAKLNDKGLIASLPGIEGKDLIILGANNLEEELLGELTRITESLDRNKFFVLADSSYGIESLKTRMAGDLAPAQEEKEEKEPEVPQVEPAEPEKEEPEIFFANAEETVPAPGETGQIPVFEDPAQVNEAPLPFETRTMPENNSEIEVTAPMDALSDLEEEDDLSAYEKPVEAEQLHSLDVTEPEEEPSQKDELLQAAMDQATASVSEEPQIHIEPALKPEDSIVFGEQLTLEGAGMEPEKEPMPVVFDTISVQKPEEEPDNPFLAHRADDEKVTLEVLTSHGLEDLKEEFPEPQLDLGELLKDKFPDNE